MSTSESNSSHLELSKENETPLSIDLLKTVPPYFRWLKCILGCMYLHT